MNKRNVIFIALCCSLLAGGILARVVFTKATIPDTDTVRREHRVVGFSKEEVEGALYSEDLVSVENVRKFLRPSPEKTYKDTIEALSFNPEHPPLYYLLARVFQDIVGNTRYAHKILSLLIGILLLPCLYLFCIELFEVRLVGVIAVFIVIFSPLHMATAAYFSQYGLYTVVILLSSAALLRALRMGRTVDWVFYALMLIAGFYTHIAFILIAVGHLAYILMLKCYRRSKHVLFSWALSFAAGIISFSPWLFVLFRSMVTLKENTTIYRSAQAKVGEIFISFARNLGDVFAWLPFSAQREFFVGLFFLGLVIASIAVLIIKTDKKKWVFLVLLMIITPVVIIAPSIVTGKGRHAYEFRYFLPTFLGMQIAMANAIALGIRGKNALGRTLCEGAITIILASGLISVIYIAKLPDFYPQRIAMAAAKVSDAINNFENPILVTDAGYVLTLLFSSNVRDDTQFLVLKGDDEAAWRKGLKKLKEEKKATNLFLVLPSKRFKAIVEEEEFFIIEAPEEGKYRNWQIVYRLNQ